MSSTRPIDVVVTYSVQTRRARALRRSVVAAALVCSHGAVVMMMWQS